MKLIYVLIIIIPLIFILCGHCGLFTGGNLEKQTTNESTKNNKQVKLEENIKIYEKKIDKLKVELSKENNDKKINILLKSIDENTIVKNDYLIKLNMLKIEKLNKTKLKGGKKSNNNNKCFEELKIITEQKDEINNLKKRVEKIKLKLKTEKSIKSDLQKKKKKVCRKLRKAKENIEILNTPLSIFTKILT